MSEWALTANRMNDDVMRCFGEAVVVRPTGLPSLTIQAHFDEAFEAVEMQNDVAVSTIKPTLLVRLSDLPATPKQDWLVDITRGTVKQYRVIDVQIDGDGMALLLLMVKL